MERFARMLGTGGELLLVVLLMSAAVTVLTLSLRLDGHFGGDAAADSSNNSSDNNSDNTSDNNSDNTSGWFAALAPAFAGLGLAAYLLLVMYIRLRLHHSQRLVSALLVGLTVVLLLFLFVLLLGLRLSSTHDDSRLSAGKVAAPLFVLDIFLIYRAVTSGV